MNNKDEFTPPHTPSPTPRSLANRNISPSDIEMQSKSPRGGSVWNTETCGHAIPPYYIPKVKDFKYWGYDHSEA